MERKFRWVTSGFAVLVAVSGALFTSTTAGAAPTDPIPEEQIQSEVGGMVDAALAPPSAHPEGGTVPNMPVRTDTNLDLIASLDFRGRCLVRNSVYPEGGIGFEDSSLPYDNFAPVDRWYETARAELLRDNAEYMSGVTVGGDENGANNRFIMHFLVTAQRTVDLESVIERGSPELNTAVAELRARGWTFEVAYTAVSNLIESCRVFEAMTDKRVAQVLDAQASSGISSAINDVTGRLEIEADSIVAPVLETVLAPFGDAALITATDTPVVPNGRSDS